MSEPREPDEVLLACQDARRDTKAYAMGAQSHADTALVAALVACTAAYVAYRCAIALKALKEGNE